jgi:phosphohistidine phosphatase
MELYVMRHGIALPREENLGRSDAVRPLTEDGLRKTGQAADGLARLGIACDRIFTSPLLRARQTAEIAAKALKIHDRIEEWPELGAQGSNEALLRRLQAAAKTKALKAAMLVGHEPQLGELVSLFLSGRPDLSVDFKKAGVCCLDLQVTPAWGRATLVWFLTPNHLRRLGQG